ncbi:MAG TPA: ABC transporter permease [Negativicutes bacterium]|nr:ABC transporter permease [Negativicutes bacterium]
MLKYIGKRFLWMIPVLLGISFILFSIMELSPGDPARMMLGDYASQADVEALRKEMGLNDPFFIRYGNYVNNILHGDFGMSYQTKKNCAEEIINRFPATLKIAGLATLIAASIGIPIGIVSAVRQYSVLDVVSVSAAMIFTSIPGFWLGLMLILLFTLKLGLLPSVGSESWKNFIMPALSMAAMFTATLTRMTRSTMLEVIRQDYIRTAKAKGATQMQIVFKHALRNTMLPVVTIMGIDFSNLLGGALIIENVFGISGLGTLMVDSVKSKDTPMLVASVLFASSVGGLVTLLVDVLYTYIDPRVRMQYIKPSK